MVKSEKPKIYIASDHAGLEVKEKLKKYLQSKKYDFNDLGPYTYEKNDDYPDYAFKVAQLVSKNNNSNGILICGTGGGTAIAANKVKGIRAVEAYDKYSAKMSKEHNNSNILTLGARNLSLDRIMKIIIIWLKTPFSNQERHIRRIKKITNFENQR